MRTAASAVAVAEVLTDLADRSLCVGVVGAGRLARMTIVALHDAAGAARRYAVHDLVPTRAEAMRALITRLSPDAEVSLHDSAADVLQQARMTVIATTAAAPHVPPLSLGSDAVVELFPNRNHSNLLDATLRERIAREMAGRYRRLQVDAR